VNEQPKARLHAFHTADGVKIRLDDGRELENRLFGSELMRGGDRAQQTVEVDLEMPHWPDTERPYVTVKIRVPLELEP
jgi:hypothetical protein